MSERSRINAVAIALALIVVCAVLSPLALWLLALHLWL